MDLEYPKYSHKLHNDYPLAPEKLSVKKEWLSSYQTELLENTSTINIEKLVPNLMDKTKLQKPTTLPISWYETQESTQNIRIR